MADNGGKSDVLPGLSPRRTSLRNFRTQRSSDRLVQSRSTDNGPSGVTSPRSLRTSATIDNSNLDGGLYASPASSTVQNSPRKQSLMSEDEVSALVHNALLRARKATRSFTPRSSPVKSMSTSSPSVKSPSPARSPSSRSPSARAATTYTSPVKSAISALEALSSPNQNQQQLQQSNSNSMRSASSRSSLRQLALSPANSFGRPPVHSYSPSSAKRPVISVPSLGEAAESPSAPRDTVVSPSGDPTSPLSPNTLRSIGSYRTARYLRSPISTPKGAVEEGSAYSGRSFDFHTPSNTADNKAGVRLDLGGHLSRSGSSKSLELQKSTTGGGLSARGSDNSIDTSSDDIIRRVEEEIANARKAAQEATRRLAGVSEEFLKKKQSRMEAKSPEVTSRVALTVASIEKDSGIGFGSGIGIGSKLPDPVPVPIHAVDDISTSTTHDEHFDSALDMIGEEFGEGSDFSVPKVSIPEVDGSSESKVVVVTDSSVIITEEKKEGDANDVSPVSPANDGIEKAKSAAAESEYCETDSSKHDIEMADTIRDEEDGNEDAAAPADIATGTSAHLETPTPTDEISKSKSEITFLSAESTRGSRTRSVEGCRLMEHGSGDETKAEQQRDEEVEDEHVTVVNVIQTTGSAPRDELEAILTDEKMLSRSETMEAVTPSDEKMLSRSETMEAATPSDERVQPAESSATAASEKIRDADAAKDESEEAPAGIETEETAQESTAAEEETAPAVEQAPEQIDDAVESSTLQAPESSAEVDASPIESKAIPSPIEQEFKEPSAHSKTMSEEEEVFEDAIQGPESSEPEATDDIDDPLLSFVESGSLAREIIGVKNEETPKEPAEDDDSKADPSITEAETEDQYSGHDHLYRRDSVSTADIPILQDQKTDVVDNRARQVTDLLSNLSPERDENVPPNDLPRVESVTSSSIHQKTLPTVEEPSVEPASEPVEPSAELSSEPAAEPLAKPSSTFVPRPIGEPIAAKPVVPPRGKKVRFKQRYPIPQRMAKPRDPSEITFDYQTEKPSDKLWLSKPKKDLKELFEATIGTSIQRRSNACGALKVLSTQQQNQLTLLRTHGFMDALVFAIGDNYSTEDAEAGVFAKTRAVNVVLNVSKKKCNRYHVLMHPGLGDSLVKVMTEDKRDARELACATLATLAKSQSCREPMSKVENLVDVLAIIMKGDEPSSFDNDRKIFSDDPKIDYSGDDEMTRVISESFSEASSASSHSYCTLDTNKGDPEMRTRTRMNACAALLHLSKECTISQALCASNTLLYCLVACCGEVHNPIHTKCLEILANLTRFPHNNRVLVDYPGVIDTLLLNGSNDVNDTDRLWAVRNFQNLASDPSAKSKLATPAVLELLSISMMRSIYGEQLAAASAVLNIATEPGTVVPLTNTKNVVATLVHVAHSPTSIAEVRTIACDALATLGLWLQTLAGAGTVPQGVKYTPLPTYITSGWERWEK